MTFSQKYGGRILLIFHIIGIVLFLVRPESASLSFLTIILCAFIVFSAEAKHLHSIIPFISILFLGFIIEVIGVQTGLLFGDYAYGKSLGWKFYGVPLIIGLNWYVIVVSSSAIAKKLAKSIPAQIVLSAALCTFLDYIIEPVAMKYDFWDWDHHEIPLLNYGCWFLFSALFSFIYIQLSNSRNRPAEVLWIVWLVFFSLLNWF